MLPLHLPHTTHHKIFAIAQPIALYANHIALFASYSPAYTSHDSKRKYHPRWCETMAPTLRSVCTCRELAYRHHAHSGSSSPHLQDLSKDVTVIINEEQPDLTATYHVPEELLVEKSQFFQAACRNEWKEAKSRVVKLPDVDPASFNCYLLWIYRARLPVRNEWDPDCDGWKSDALAVQSNLVKLWILADRLADARLRNAIMDEMVTATDKLELAYGFVLFHPEMTVLVWSATTANRPLRRLILDYYVFYVSVEYVEKDVDKHHPEFVKELMLASLRMVDDRCEDWVYPKEKGSCHYHEHDETTPEHECQQDE